MLRFLRPACNVRRRETRKWFSCPKQFHSLLSLSWRKFLSQAILPWVHSLLRKCWWTSSKDWSHKSSQAARTCTTTSGYLDIIRCRMYNGLSIVHVFVKVTLSFSSVPFPGKCFFCSWFVGTSGGL